MVATEINLVSYYEVSSVRAAANAVRAEVEVSPTRYDSLEIMVMTQDPQMAALIANTYAKALDRLNKEFTITATKRVRHYVEGRLAEKAQGLTKAENAVRKFQDDNRVWGRPPIVLRCCLHWRTNG